MRRHPWHHFRREDEEQSANRQTASLAALALLVSLVLASLLVMRALNNKTAIEDCLMAGRRNCDSVVAVQAGR